MNRMHALRTVPILPLLLLLTAPAAAQQDAGEPPAIEVNGFFVEEAYNQEAGQLQQIGRSLVARGGAWAGEYTQEWPIRSERHQLELSAAVAHHQALAALGAGYRFLVIGDEGAPLALSPGVEVAWAREAAEDGEMENEWEVEALLPASIQLAHGLTASTNLGASFQLGEEDAEPGWSVGQGLVWRATPRLNLLVEAVWSRGESPLGEVESDEASLVVSPGLQYALVLRDGLQVVPGLAFPVGVGPSEGQRAVMFYLSLEHPFGRGGR